MNDRIKQLTRSYLDSLNLPYYQLNDNQKQEIIRINGETEWIIFNAGSLLAKRQESEGYTPMLRVDENGYFWFKTFRGYERGEHIDDYIRRNRNEMGLVGNYKLGVRKNGIFREGEVEEEFDNYNNRIGYRQNVFGQLQGTNGNVGPLQELRAVGTEMNRGFSPEAYEMTPFQLQDIWQEAVKIYYTYYQNHLHELPDGVTGVEDIDINELEKPNIFTFIGGDGDRVGVDSAVVEHIRTNPAFPVNYSGRGREDYWGAVNKNKIVEQMYHWSEPMIRLSRSGWKKSQNLADLLNDNDIVNSREQVADTSSTGDSHTTSNQQTPPPPPHQQPTIIRDLTFTIDSVGPGYNGNPHYITLSAPLVVEDVDIYLIFIQSNDPLLQDGNRVIIRDVSFGPGQAEVDHFAHDISIKTFFRTIDLVSTTSPPGGGISTPNNPPPPPSFPDVVKKNHDLINEENSFFKLRDELKDIINQNKSVVQEAQTLGLTLPSFSDNALDFFQTAPFIIFDAGQPLNSPFNQQTSDKNDKTRQKALNLKNNIYQIYNSNVKKLDEKKQGEQGGSPPPENELTKLKKQAIEKINTILTDPDNLRNIDLNTLAGGKYRNWENDIMGLNTVDEANDYLNAFSAALKEKGVEEKEIEEQEKNDNSSDHDSQKNNDVVDDKIKNFISNLPLPSAKNVAKSKILELFRKHRPDLEKLKEIWAGYDSWMERLDSLTSSAEVVAFLEKMEQAMVQQSQNRETRASTHPPQNSAIVPLLIIGFTLLAGLTFVVLLRQRRKKIK